MKRTTIMLPPELKERALERARQRGISLGELIRWCLGVTLDRPGELTGDDPMLADDVAFEGEVPFDLSSRHDDHLYEDEP